MKNTGDGIQFESRREVENLLVMISRYWAQNPSEKDNMDLCHLHRLLNYIDMNW